MLRLSVIIITKNEAENIRPCLETVRWADEIVVVDSGSSDGTQAICREYSDKVFVTDWPGFGAQKNRALAYASGEWVLSIDADERVTPTLHTEIEQAIANERYAAYGIPRLSSYCGCVLRHGGWWPDIVIRLFRRDQARFSDARIHERLEVKGVVGFLNSPLLHYSFRNLEQVLEKVNGYSTEGARMLASRGKKANLGSAIGHGLWAFLRIYLLKRGFLDGREGFIMAVSNAEGTYYRYLKLMYLSEADRDQRMDDR